MENKIKSMGFVALRIVILMTLTALISAFSRFLFVENMFEQEYFSEQILNVWHMVFFLLIFNSLTLAIKRHDRYSCEKFLERAENNQLIFHVKFMVFSLDFYVEIGCVIGLSILLPVRLLYSFVSKVFFHGIELTPSNSKLYTLLIILPIMCVLFFVARIVIQRNWYLNAQKDKEGAAKAQTLPVLKSVIIVAIVYFCGSVCIPWLLPLLITVWNLGGVKLLVGILLAFAAFILIAVIAYCIRALLKRISFVKKLKKYCISNSIYLSEINKPYISLFSQQDGAAFCVGKDGVKYDCKLIAGIFPGSPIIFSDRGNGLIQHTICLFRIEVFHYMTKFDFGYESEGEKILIVLPTPKRFFVSTNEAPPHPADVGEKAGEYMIYNSTGFFNALERGVL